MDAVQERSPRLIVLVELVYLVVVHHCAIGICPALRIPRFQREGRIDHRKRNKLVVSNMDTAEAAFGNGDGTGKRRPTDPDNG
jgi:hypothetical protein